MSEPTNDACREEAKRLEANALLDIPIERWGPYLSQRQWGTVREDYSAGGQPWEYLTHDQSRSKAYRWGEDGIGGICDRSQFICFAFSFWNGKDPILKERLFGLSNPEGNHGEDCKELYYFLDNLPTHSYMKFLYKYPQAEFPYDQLVTENARRTRADREYELLDTGIFNDGNYFDITIEYAKASKEDVCIKATIRNYSSSPAELHLIPTLWFRNTWQTGTNKEKPVMRSQGGEHGCPVNLSHPVIGDYYFYYQEDSTYELFTENETNTERLYNSPNDHPYKKDAFHQVVVNGQNDLLAARKSGTKFGAIYKVLVEPGDSRSLLFRISQQPIHGDYRNGMDAIFEQRKKEADEFYLALLPQGITEDRRNIARQAFAGLLWNKQFYHYDVTDWLDGDDGNVPPPAERLSGRNSTWRFLNNRDIILMPDNWEYPWYAAWDLAFHCIPMAFVDPVFAKNQLILIMREWYMSPQGQIPAYEWNFSDVNPPVHAWAALSVYRIDKHRTGRGDIDFLKRVFSKLTINFTWWVNRKDENGHNIFEGGFLGLDNIGIINRSDLPEGYRLQQVDGTSWMAMFALSMLEISLEICQHDKSYEDIVTKFYEHYILIAESLDEATLWNEEDGFYYDVLMPASQEPIKMKVYSAVGLSVLFANGIMHNSDFNLLPDLARRTRWFKQDRARKKKFSPYEIRSGEDAFLLSLVSEEKLLRILSRLFHEEEFLSPGGVRSLSKYHNTNPIRLNIDGAEFGISYDPGDATTSMFGGNSNWRGPVWFPINYLLIKSLNKYFRFYGDRLKIEYPTGSGNWVTLQQASRNLADRLTGIFEADVNGKRKVHGMYNWFYQRPENKDLVLFYEYFHGEDLSGLGASHQTGWTAVVAELMLHQAWEPGHHDA